jgi:hypothetical protein
MKGYEVRAHLFWNQTCELAVINVRMVVNLGKSYDSRTCLHASGCHVKLSCKICAHDAIWFLVMGKGLFEDFELGLCRPLSVFYLVGDVGIELPEVDE